MIYADGGQIEQILINLDVGMGGITCLQKLLAKDGSAKILISSGDAFEIRCWMFDVHSFNAASLIFQINVKRNVLVKDRSGLAG